MPAGGQWKAAQEVFEQMLPCGCKPDGMTYGILIGAYDKGNQWCLALQVLNDPFLIIAFHFTCLPHLHVWLFVHMGCTTCREDVQECCAHAHADTA